jgi:hypothetical protein
MTTFNGPSPTMVLAVLLPDKPIMSRAQVLSQWRRIMSNSYMFTTREKFDAGFFLLTEAIRQLALDAHISAKELRRIMIEDARLENDEQARRELALREGQAWADSAGADCDSFQLLCASNHSW